MFRPSSANSVQCFFCNQHIHNPRNPRNFRCNHCGCWNRYDDTGEISSYEPAMSDESLNARSFSKRASPSKNRLPTAYGSGPFCHTCQTNQMLLVNLLSNYLPAPSNPEYERRLEMLPEYRESLHVRYPPVCDNCMPAVEEEIRKKDSMARSQALGGWLKETKGKTTQRRVSQTPEQRLRVSKQLLIWRARGCLWCLTLCVALFGNIIAAVNESLFSPLAPLHLLPAILPLLVLVSILWTAWDPTYASVTNARIEGRDVRVQGKQTYNYLQMSAWLSRLITSSLLAVRWYRPHLDILHLSHFPLRTRVYFTGSFLLELAILTYSFVVLRVQQPPAIRLIDSKTLSSRSNTPISDQANPRSRTGTPIPPKLPEPDMFASLTLSNKPVVTSKAPVFGIPSLLSSTPPTEEDRAKDDEMDWSPTSENVNPTLPMSPGKRAPVDDGSWLRPQRFFAPENPTGLETLFEKTKLVDDVTMSDLASGQAPMRIIKAHLERWWWMYGAGLVLVVGVGLRIWLGQKLSNEQILLEHPLPGIVDELSSSGVYRHTQRPVDLNEI
ncbi:hypothetical protein D9758_000442 [Tetrapyrgos nigripes]|uniref:Ima1 N-terminal domain-containing protein n=1 Tax=Tetrapyrgos nigripes TaxID=182062 RepID=A0A8H5H1K0_9AGAR|nr:hypothetical protein D9758_000442 [Tetrapyrgos nigripes]